MSEVEAEVREIISDHAGVEPDALDGHTRICEDLRLAGDDVDDLVLEIAKRFDVDLSNYRWYHHSEMEGCNPFWLVIKPWWAKAEPIPLTVDVLVRSARERKWCVKYPHPPLQPKSDIANWLLNIFLLVIVSFFIVAKCSGATP